MSVAASPPPDFCYPPGTISVDRALAHMLERARAADGCEDVLLDDALGRVLASALKSPIDVPGYANSQMDGYAVRASEVGDGAALPVTQRVVAGRVGTALAPASAARIFTGAPLPPGADSVVMQERCREHGDRVTIPGPVPHGDNVRPRGNDIGVGQVVLEAGERMRPQHIGLAASLGLQSVPVYRRLRVAIFSSGDELKAPGEALAPGQIYNSNRFTLHAALTVLGAELIDIGRVADSLQATETALRDAAAVADVVVGSGGMSVGDEDHVKAALERAGRMELWRVAVKPGKPLAYGRIGGADFVGLPGNPVSTLVTFALFVRPFLLARMGALRVRPRMWPVRAGFDWTPARARREFARARLEQDGHALPLATLHPRQGSDVMSSTTWADGLVEIPEGTTVRRGELLRFADFDSLLG